LEKRYPFLEFSIPGGALVHARLRSVDVAATAMCAALYEAGCLLTAYIQSPWGFGQFRPAVIIPAVFAVVFGPWPAALGAAIGTLIADSVKHATLYLPSLVAAVPGNFLGFYMLGWYLRGRFSWRRFVTISIIMLVVANAVVAFLYVPTIYFLGFLPKALGTTDLILFASALTIWWFATMLPFMLFLTPPIIKAVAKGAPHLVPEDVKMASLTGEDRRLFILALLLPGLVFLGLGGLLALTPLGSLVFRGLTVKLKPGFAALSLEAMSWLLATSGGGLCILGLAFALWSYLLGRSSA